MNIAVQKPDLSRIMSAYCLAYHMTYIFNIILSTTYQSALLAIDRFGGEYKKKCTTTSISSTGVY